MPPQRDTGSPATTSAYPRLFEPLAIAGQEARNRLVCLPHSAGFVAGGLVTQEYTPYLERLTRATAGMVILGGSIVHESSWGHDRQLRTFDAAVIDGLSPLVDAVRGAGGLFVGQLLHLGRETRSTRVGVPLWAPSALASPIFGEIPHAVSLEEIDAVARGFVDSARHMFDSGADGVEVHAAHGYLLQQFLSPLSNRRTDAYGGGLGGRARLLREIVAAVRAVADGRIVGLRVSAGEGRTDGLRWEEVLEVVAGLEGAIDYVSLAVPSTAKRYVRDAAFAPGGLGGHGAELRRVVSVPVLVSQRVDHPSVASRLLESGEADLVGLARALIADPDWGAKARSGKADEIRPCIACLEDCRRVAQTTIGCSVNPDFGHAFRRGVRPAGGARRRHVVVVGAGPAGCLAALRCAATGCAVTLLEAGPAPGGRARVAGAAPNRGTWLAYADYLARAVRGAPGVDVRTSTTATVALVAALAPAVVVRATGARQMLDVPCTSKIRTMTADELLTLPSPLPAGIALVLDHGGGWDAAGAVEALARWGWEVAYVTAADRVGDRIPEESREDLLDRFEEAAVRAYTRARLTPRGSGVEVRMRTARVQVIETPALLVSAGRLVPVSPDLGTEERHGWRVLSVGDCVAPRGLSVATREGHGVTEHI